MNLTRRILSTSIAAAAALAPARAATIYWDGTGTLWSATGSWSTDGGLALPDPAAVPGAADLAQFNISALNSAQTVSLNANQTVAGLIFSSTDTTPRAGRW